MSFIADVIFRYVLKIWAYIWKILDVLENTAIFSNPADTQCHHHSSIAILQVLVRLGSTPF